MMKYYFLLIFFLFKLTSCQKKKTNLNTCKLETVKKINFGNLPSLLSNSLWKYTKSFTKDSCFHIINFDGLDIPREMEWVSSKDSLELDTLSSIYLIRKTDLFRNLKSIVKINGKRFETFPFCVNDNKEFSELSKLKVIHNSKQDEKVPKKFYYFIIQCIGDSLLIEDQKVYEINEIKYSGVRHLFLKNKIGKG